MAKETNWYSNVNKITERANTGDLIEIIDPVFRHWMVYADKDDDGTPMIVHFYKWGKDRYRVLFDPLEVVADCREMKIHNKYDRRSTPKSVKEIMQNANWAYEQDINGNYRGYDAVNWNCEHFATWCRYGKGYSDQSTGRNLLNPINWAESIASALINGAKASISSSSSSSKNKTKCKEFATNMSKKYGI